MAFLIAEGRVLAFLWGAVWASFGNVVIHRLPRGQSLVSPPSHCPRCNARIRWYDNVPILGWLWLRGRCRDCRNRISVRYPLVELLGGVLSLLLFEHYVAGGPVDVPLLARLAPFLVYFAFSFALLIVTFIDIDLQLVPTVITLPGTALGLLMSLILVRITFLESVAGIVCGAGVLYVINAGYRAVRGRSGFGDGDLALLAMIGAFCGVQSLIFVLLAASLQGTLAAAVFGLVRRIFGVTIGLKSADGIDDEVLEDEEWTPMDAAGEDTSVGQAALAFVPFLSLAAVEWLLVGPQLLDSYFSFVGSMAAPGGG